MDTPQTPAVDEPETPAVDPEATVQYDEGDLDATRLYEDEGDDKSSNASHWAGRVYPTWLSSSSSPAEEAWAGYAALRGDFLAHAVQDAEYVLACSSREQQGSSELAWTAEEADLVIPGCFSTSACFWYDVREIQL